MHSDIALGLACILGWGLADFLVAKYAQSIHPARLLFWVQLVGLVVVFVLFLLGGIPSAQRGVNVTAMAWLATSGLLQGLGYVLFYKGLQKGKAGLVSAISSAYPFVVVLIGVGFAGESLEPIAIFAITLILLGIIVASAKLGILNHVQLDQHLTPLGLLYSLPTMLLWGISLSILSYAVADIGWIEAVLVMRAFMVLAGGIWLAIENQGLDPGNIAVLSRAAFIGALDVGAFLSFALGTRVGRATVVAPISAGFPMLTVILARIWLGQRMSPIQYLGVCVVLIGIAILAYFS